MSKTKELVGVLKNNVDDKAAKQEYAEQSFESMRAKAAERGFFTDEEIEAEIKEARMEIQMKEAAKDKAFIERTMKCAEDFKYVDSEVEEV